MLAVDDLAVSYGAVHAVRGLSLTVATGEIVALLGANGAGKSSTLNAVMGLVPAASGRVEFAGQSVSGLAPERIVRLGMTLTPEGRHVFPNLSVDENLALGAATRNERRAIEATRAEVFELFPVLAERRTQLAGTLSGGEQQMLAIGRSLMSVPKLLLLDEPSLGLAPQIVDLIFDLIARLRTRGLTILLVEQSVDRALEIADRGYVLRNGQLAMAGRAGELRASTGVERAYMGLADV
ncbi:MAG: ABC transporter ATP-binding protein [Alphaproteobacteria bacterium]|nr:ABC transporter ATP-binding protein [Alphaproteobacteria bacterium]